ncbi:MAG: type I-U CRISPR-associated protein Cas8c [Planctomycetaceae bacterium]
MNHSAANITVKVDLTNPGQFFACCGLLELADRLWPGAEGWFEDAEFCVVSSGTWDDLLQQITNAELEQINPADDMSSPMRLPAPFRLNLDWWTDEIAGGKQLKVWAGSMRNVRIARAMQKAIVKASDAEQLFAYTAIVYDPDHKKKKVEPYYFDSRRGWNAQSLDIGFAPDSLKMTTMAYPAVEFLCLVGLQRFRPAMTKRRRVFDYFTWSKPLSATTAAAVANGMLRMPNAQAYRFENAFRTDQKKHKSFLPATPLGVS